ncbi:MAG: hypothetical protein IPL01_08855 [Acidobacteria bacterium]|nr:hypothetical protein [Acidobacteriota bacterium]
MGKTSKKTQTLSLERLKQIQPNTGVGGSAPGGGPQPVRFDGVPEHVPELTFIVERRVANDNFINGATTYHTNCGLNPQTISSIENLVTQLSASNGHLRRIRIVTHAHPTNLAVAMFEGSTVYHAEKEYIRGFAQDDISGIRAILGMTGNRHFLSWNIFTITSYIRGNSPNILTPFGLNTSGTPSDSLREYIFCCADYFFAGTNSVTKNNQALTASERTNLRSALNVIIGQTGSSIIGTRFGTHQVVQADLDALRSFVVAMTLANFGFGSGNWNFTFEPASNIFTLAARAVAAIQNNFRTKLNQVRQRFNEESVIDVRGCRAGQDSDYLEALREFFGAGTHKPRVSAPRWYQFFGSSSYSHPQNNNEIHTLLFNGANAQTNRDGFADWATRMKVDLLHKTFWIDLLNGNVIRFCLLNWRTSIPKLPVATPGLTAFESLNFRDSVNKIRDFFNVAAGSTPAGAVLTTLHDFVTNSLNGWGPNLLEQVNTSTTGTRLQQLFDALKLINTALSQSIVPATAPSPLQATNISSYQTALIEFIRTNRLSQIQPFMTAVKQRIEDANDPGISYYMLHAGLPVFVFANREQVAAHVVTVTRNRLVVHDTYATEAYRQWPQLLWAEPLPAGNTIGTLQPGDADSRRFAMMVEAADGGNTQVATCPHPDYNDKIQTVP